MQHRRKCGECLLVIWELELPRGVVLGRHGQTRYVCVGGSPVAESGGGAVGLWRRVLPSAGCLAPCHQTRYHHHRDRENNVLEFHSSHTLHIYRFYLYLATKLRQVVVPGSRVCAAPSAHLYVRLSTRACAYLAIRVIAHAW